MRQWIIRVGRASIPEPCDRAPATALVSKRAPPKHSNRKHHAKTLWRRYGAVASPRGLPEPAGERQVTIRQLAHPSVN